MKLSGLLWKFRFLGLLGLLELLGLLGLLQLMSSLTVWVIRFIRIIRVIRVTWGDSSGWATLEKSDWETGQSQTW